MAGTAVGIAIVTPSRTFPSLNSSSSWRQTWDTCQYFTVVIQSEARVRNEHRLNIYVIYHRLWWLKPRLIIHFAHPNCWKSSWHLSPWIMAHSAAFVGIFLDEVVFRWANRTTLNGFFNETLAQIQQSEILCRIVWIYCYSRNAQKRIPVSIRFEF